MLVLLSLGPLGAVAGVFIQGEPAKVERGAELFLETLEDKEIAGPLVGETEEALLFRPREMETLEYEEVWEEDIFQEEIHEEIEEIPQEEPITWEEPEVEVEIRPYEEW